MIPFAAGLARQVFAPALVLALVTIHAGCGYPGAPLPPALNIPVPISDLRSIQFGGQLLVEFTLPALTTDGLPLDGVRQVELIAGPGPSPFSEAAWEAGAQSFEIPDRDPGPVEFQLPVDSFLAPPAGGGQTLVMGVRVTGPSRRRSSWSNLWIQPVAAPLAQPAEVAATNDREGVRISWNGTGPRYRVLRAVGSDDLEMQLVPIGETDTSAFLDPATEYDIEYRYVVVAINGDAQQSLGSDPVAITPADVFAPATPAGLSAIAGADSVELAWARNTEADFASYSVYRAAGDETFAPLATGIGLPAFSDRTVAAGTAYRYQVSSTDASGNESDPSEVVEVRVE